MEREYDAERHASIYTCSHCHYKYADVDWEQRKSDEGNEPFIEMREMMHHSDVFGRGQYVSHIVYACPKCGILQIEV